MYVQYSVQPQGEQVRGLVSQESSPMTFKHFVPLQESKTDPLLHLAQTLRVIEEFVSFQFSEKVILKFTLKKKNQFLPSLLLLRNPSAHTNSIQWVSHIFKEKCRHSFASPSPCFKGTSQGQFHCQVQYKWKLFDAIEFCPFFSYPSWLKPDSMP